MLKKLLDKLSSIRKDWKDRNALRLPKEKEFIPLSERLRKMEEDAASEYLKNNNPSVIKNEEKAPDFIPEP